MIKIFSFLLAISLIAPGAHAANSCADLFIDCDKSTLPLPTLEALALEEPEVEAKLSVPDKETLKRMRELVGQDIVVNDQNGKPITFKVEFNKEHIYEDTYFDIGDSEHLNLFGKGALLRQRKRSDKEPGAKKFSARYINFQAKNGAATDTGMNTAVYARNEIRGEKTKKFDKFMDHRKDQLSADSKDKAVRYAREAASSAGKFKQVLLATQERYFMKVSQKNGNDASVPAFYVSLDKVTFVGLMGERKEAKERFVEIEIIDDLNADQAADSTSKLFLLNQLTSQLQAKYALKGAQDDKYVTGVKLTVLKAKP